MRLAIVGIGTIGTTIGHRWEQAGHKVVYATRDPDAERYQALAREAAVESIPEAVRRADATLISIPGNAVENLLDTYGEILNGKLLLDATNSLSGPHFHQASLFEERLPAAQVYRAFNSLGWEVFADPRFDGERPDLFYSGPDGEDRSTVERLIGDVGLRPVYIGSGIDAANLLDAVTRLYFTLASGQGHGRHLAFRTLGLAESGKS